MGSFSIVHLMIVVVIVLLLFGAGRLSNVMGEFAKGIKAFRAGMREDEPPHVPLQSTPVPPPIQQPMPPRETAEAAAPERKVG